MILIVFVIVFVNFVLKIWKLADETLFPLHKSRNQASKAGIWQKYGLICSLFLSREGLSFLNFWRSWTSPQNRPLLVVRYWSILRVSAIWGSMKERNHWSLRSSSTSWFMKGITMERSHSSAYSVARDFMIKRLEDWSTTRGSMKDTTIEVHQM